METGDIQDIMQVLPHRYPFLLMDRVLELVPKESIKAIKNVTINEPFFQGHFPKHPVMPGVLTLEAMAQVAGYLAFKSSDLTLDGNQIVLLVGIDNVRFKRPVVPGDQLEMTCSVSKVKRGIWVFQCESRVAGELASTAEIMCTLKGA